MSMLGSRSRSTFSTNGGKRGATPIEEERKRTPTRNSTSSLRCYSVRGMFLKSLVTETQKFLSNKI
jgi:hypothetical protein